MVKRLSQLQREPGWGRKEKIISQSGKSIGRIQEELRNSGFDHSKKYISAIRHYLRKQGVPIFPGGHPISVIASKIKGEFDPSIALEYLRHESIHPVIRAFALIPNINMNRVSKLTGFSYGAVYKILSNLKANSSKRENLMGNNKKKEK